jgi:hypothetical protein
MTWNVLITNANAEAKVSSFLTDKGMIVYYPQIRYPYIRRHAVAIRSKAAFSRYIFLNAPAPYHLLSHTPGLEGVMRVNGFYSEVTDNMILDIKDRESHGFFDHNSICAIHDLQAKVLGMASRGRAKVSIRLFNAEREATLTV